MRKPNGFIACTPGLPYLKAYKLDHEAKLSDHILLSDLPKRLVVFQEALCLGTPLRSIPSLLCRQFHAKMSSQFNARQAVSAVSYHGRAPAAPNLQCLLFGSPKDGKQVGTFRMALWTPAIFAILAVPILAHSQRCQSENVPVQSIFQSLLTPIS